jgi:hypothetical protein
MRQRLVIIVTLVVVVGVLVALNAATYVDVEKAAESEASPDRSTFNSGATGTRAFYDFLHESGYQVARWRDSTDSLLSLSGPRPATIVVVGRTAIPFSKAEVKGLLLWVANGGRLVIIDRNPDPNLLPPSGDWRTGVSMTSYPRSDVDPTNLEQMTTGVEPVPPSQPTLMARGVETILPSRFAGTVHVEPIRKAGTNKANEAQPEAQTDEPEDDSETLEEPETDGDKPLALKGDGSKVSPAPIVNFAREGGALVAEYPHGAGRIVVLSDPFIVANNGINRADNLQFAINLVTGGGGLVAFDEFHHGHEATHNALIQYFAGTPVLAICGQFALLGLMVIWSRSRRFARPMPLAQVDRRSSLEFVASMAELQQRARAHDLALENIYGRVRRVLVRHAGLNNSSSRSEIAARVAARSGLGRQALETLMRNCEDTINGAPTNAKESLRMARRLRQLESTLGLGMRARDVRQAAEKTEL